MSEIRIELDKTDLKELEEFARGFKDDLREALEYVADKAMDYALAGSPEDEGTFKEGYWTEVTGSGSDLDAWIGNTARTAHLIEFGYARHFAPFRRSSRLRIWAEKRGLPVESLWGLELSKPKRSENHGYVITPAIDQAGDFFPSRLSEKVERRWAR